MEDPGAGGFLSGCVFRPLRVVVVLLLSVLALLNQCLLLVEYLHLHPLLTFLHTCHGPQLMIVFIKGAWPLQVSLSHVYVIVTQSCPTLCDPSTDCSPPGFSIHGILQARILEWVIFPAPGDLPNPGIKPGSLALKML